MPGFRLPVEPLTVAISEGKWTGVEVEIDGNYQPAAKVALLGLMAAPKRETAKAQEQRGRELFSVLARLILGWNVEDHHGPIPTTPEGFALCPPDLIATVIAHSAALTT
jgi:hypothetical protein